ncbi:MAG: hypothetical protein MJE68_34010 [Proteobacteria bacterium]|nr:hypothetical protein [Pseudomonadota bacterium]
MILSIVFKGALIINYLFIVFRRPTHIKPLPLLMVPSPMLCIPIDVETCSGLEEPPLVTMEAQLEDSMKTIPYLVLLQTVLLALTLV